MSDAERCIFCGKVIPEGRQYCLNCESSLSKINFNIEQHGAEKPGNCSKAAKRFERIAKYIQSKIKWRRK